MDFDIPLPQRVAATLSRAGINSTSALLALNRRQLRELPGVGSQTVDHVWNALLKADLALALDPWAPYACARHNGQAGDVSLASFYLCENCRHDYAVMSFSGQSPEWISSEKISGYCAHCNDKFADVRLTQWFLCDLCERVLRSIGRGLASAKYVLEVWERENIGQQTGLRLIETDPPRLRPRVPRSDPDRVSRPDFTLFDRSSDPVAGFELKSGKKAAARGGGIGDPMSSFQLDTTDCDDICAVVNRENIPVYVVHAQVLGRAEPPTERYYGVGMWWVDLWTMSEKFKTSAMRSREARTAAYYDTSMFRPVETFGQFVCDGGITIDYTKLQRKGLPRLYF